MGKTLKHQGRTELNNQFAPKVGLLCVGVCWCVLVCVGVCWGVLVCVGVCWGVLGCVGVCWCVSQHDPTSLSTAKKKKNGLSRTNLIEILFGLSRKKGPLA